MTIVFDPNWLRRPSAPASPGLLEEEGIFYYFASRSPSLVKAAIWGAAPRFRHEPATAGLLADALGNEHVVMLSAPHVGTAATSLQAKGSRDGGLYELTFSRDAGNGFAVQSIRVLPAG